MVKHSFQNIIKQSHTVLPTRAKASAARFEPDRAIWAEGEMELSIAETGGQRMLLERRIVRQVSRGYAVVRKYLAIEMRGWLDNTKRVLPREDVGTFEQFRTTRQRNGCDVTTLCNADADQVSAIELSQLQVHRFTLRSRLHVQATRSL
jgi:hypothetical protein